MADIVKELIKDYGLSRDDIWPVPGRRDGAHAIKHAALERIATVRGITFDHPQILEGSGVDKVVAMLVTARMGDRVEWSIGEAAPANNKNQYPWAMAEKRGKDRCILKLLNAHGAIYSEDEFDDSRTVRVTQTKPPPLSIDDEPFEGNGKPVASNAIKNYAPDLWPQFQTAVYSCTTVSELVGIKRNWRAEVEKWSDAWRNTANDICDKQRDDLFAAREAAQ